MPASPRSPKRDIARASAGTPAAYQQLHRQFGWKVPKRFNMAAECAARWSNAPDGAWRIAIRSYQEDGSTQTYSYAHLQTEANRLSNALRAQGVQRGDRVAIVMPQCFDTAVAYIAVLQMGAVAMPLSMLFGPEALAYRLQDSDAVLAICHESVLSAVLALQSQCPKLRVVRSAQAPQGKASFKPVSTLAEDPAVLIYTSGTTGNPKGALIPHRALIGNLTIERIDLAIEQFDLRIIWRSRRQLADLRLCCNALGIKAGDHLCDHHRTLYGIHHQFTVTKFFKFLVQ